MKNDQLNPTRKVVEKNGSDSNWPGKYTQMVRVVTINDYQKEHSKILFFHARCAQVAKDAKFFRRYFLAISIAFSRAAWLRSRNASN